MPGASNCPSWALSTGGAPSPSSCRRVLERHGFRASTFGFCTIGFGFGFGFSGSFFFSTTIAVATRAFFFWDTLSAYPKTSTWITSDPMMKTLRTLATRLAR